MRKNQRFRTSYNESKVNFSSKIKSLYRNKYRTKKLHIWFKSRLQIIDREIICLHLKFLKNHENLIRMRKNRRFRTSCIESKVNFTSKIKSLYSNKYRTKKLHIWLESRLQIINKGIIYLALKFLKKHENPVTNSNRIFK